MSKVVITCPTCFAKNRVDESKRSTAKCGKCSLFLERPAKTDSSVHKTENKSGNEQDIVSQITYALDVTENLDKTKLKKESFEKELEETQKGPLYPVINLLFASDRASLACYVFALILQWLLIGDIIRLFNGTFSIFSYIIVPSLIYAGIGILIGLVNLPLGLMKFHRDKEQRINQDLQSVTEQYQRLEEKRNRITSIPNVYKHTPILRKLKSYFVNKRADTLKEAINLFELEKTHQESREHMEKTVHKATEKMASSINDLRDEVEEARSDIHNVEKEIRY